MLTLAACSDDSGGGTTDVDFQGTFASSVSAGRLTFGGTVSTVRAPEGTMAASASFPVTGTMTFLGGTTVNLTGTIDGTSLTLTGGGYTFTGTQSGIVFSGTYTGPGVGEQGVFTATLSTEDDPVKVLCGEYFEAEIYSGYFNLALKPDRNGGVIVVSAEGDGAQLGKARPKAGTSDQVEVTPDAAPTFVIATGTLTGGGNQITGTWDDGESSGTFEGSVAACSAN